ncbi:CPBP family intramembrane metalloprotease [Patescibacteria group bacterium]|nr:CPBP family intramembrane metalloprotease [Patescibacteria group bacterium]
MKEETKKQLKVYTILVIILAAAAALSVFFLGSIQVGGQEIPMEIEIPLYLGALANFGMMLIGYGLVGLLGYYLSKKLGWPGIFNERENWKRLFLRPLYLGVIAGIILIIAQKVFVLFHNLGELPHPAFPLSFFASITAGIGEELMFRLFLLSFWAFILHLLFKRFKKQNITNWIAVIIAALVFGAVHFPTAMILYGFTSLSQFPIIFIVEILLLNGIVGVVAGREFIKYGFIAAVGIHFWVDIVWHVMYGLF